MEKLASRIFVIVGFGLSVMACDIAPSSERDAHSPTNLDSTGSQLLGTDTSNPIGPETTPYLSAVIMEVLNPPQPPSAGALDVFSSGEHLKQKEFPTTFVCREEIGDPTDGLGLGYRIFLSTETQGDLVIEGLSEVSVLDLPFLPSGLVVASCEVELFDADGELIDVKSSNEVLVNFNVQAELMSPHFQKGF